MNERAINLMSEEDCYLIEGNSHVVIWKTGDVVVETPEMGLRGGIEAKAVKGLSLDEKTLELSIQFLQSGSLNQIPVGLVNDYEKALNWVNSVNELYKN